jgi:hypothetical protein
MTNRNIAHPSMRGFRYGLGKILPFWPSSIPALASAFTTAVMVPDCPRTCCASNASKQTMVVMCHPSESGELGYRARK